MPQADLVHGVQRHPGAGQQAGALLHTQAFSPAVGGEARDDSQGPRGERFQLVQDFLERFRGSEADLYPPRKNRHQCLYFLPHGPAGGGVIMDHQHVFGPGLQAQGRLQGAGGVLHLRQPRHFLLPLEQGRGKTVDAAEHQWDAGKELLPVTPRHVQGAVVQGDDQVDLSAPVLGGQVSPQPFHLIRAGETLGIQVFDAGFDPRVALVQPIQDPGQLFV